jgi:3-oxoacyl-[acyl-carrier protein] reductase
MRDVAPLRGQVAIVTGAAQGIGRGIALVLADAGAHVLTITRKRGIRDRPPAGELRSGGELR